jgi:hypothetical protein
MVFGTWAESSPFRAASPLVDYLTVIDAERTLLSNQPSRADTNDI